MNEIPQILFTIIFKAIAFSVVSYAHTNWFCVVQENIKPEVLKVQTELASYVH